jgi:hypothetical protein
MTPEQKRAATLQAKKDKVRASCALYERVIQGVCDQHLGTHFVSGGRGVSCFVWATVEVSDGKKVKHVKLCAASANGLVIDDKFEQAMKALPGVMSYYINLD